MPESVPNDDERIDKLYAGILITARTVSLLIGRCVRSGPDSLAPFSFQPYLDGERDGEFAFETLAQAQKLLSLITASLMHLPEKPIGIGVASYGPLKSVSIQMRNRIYFNQLYRGDNNLYDYRDPQRNQILEQWPYGVVAETSAHEAIRGLDVYGIVREQLRSMGDSDDYWDKLCVAVNTDVTCGALCEAFHAHYRSRSDPHRLLRAEDDTVVFLNLAEGIGGAFVINKKTTGSANHPEMGYVALRLDQKSGSELSPVYVEDIASTQSILVRSGRSDWDQLTEEDWICAVDSTAQLCASITFILSPHQIVLHGPVSRLVAQVDGLDTPFAQLVQQGMKKWMSVGRRSPNDDGQVPYVEYREMTDDDFIATSYRPSWSTKPHPIGSVDPMLYGALIYGAQTPAEIESKHHG